MEEEALSNERVDEALRVLGLGDRLNTVIKPEQDTGAPGSGTRFAMTDQLLNRLSDRRRLVVIGEAQNLNRDCFEYLRHLHDDPATRFALLFDGGDGCWEVLAREPMLRSRIYRRIGFRALSDGDVLALIPGYHPIYAGIDPELLILINDKAANGRLRSWAAFTLTASELCRQLGAERITREIARTAISQLGTAP